MSLTEADVLFEMVLPLLCKEHAAAMERFKGVVVFEQTGTEPRHWTLKGGAKPWVQRGDTAKADARISVDTDVVKAVVRGYDLDPQQLGSLVRFTGSVRILEELGFSWSESKRLLDVVLKR
jgi:hypothetical protein